MGCAVIVVLWLWRNKSLDLILPEVAWVISATTRLFGHECLLFLDDFLNCSSSLEILLRPINGHDDSFSRCYGGLATFLLPFSLVTPVQPALQLDSSFLLPFSLMRSRTRVPGAARWAAEAAFDLFSSRVERGSGSVGDWVYVLLAGVVKLEGWTLLFIIVEGSPLL